jgi:anti-sigma factor RsiW
MAEFTSSFPDDPELKRLVQAFEAGDYHAVRTGAPALAERTTDDAVRKAARELRRRIEPDPAQLYLLGLTFALLVFLAIWFYVHKH